MRVSKGWKDQAATGARGNSKVGTALRLECSSFALLYSSFSS